MNRHDAEKIIGEYIKPIFGFALKRCKSIHDAEDLSQEIVVKVFRTLLFKDDIADTNKYIWAVAHNVLSDYYRESGKSVVGVSLDEVADFIADPDSVFDGCDDADSIRRLQSEIAYLSKLQRKIVIAYYFENRKQVDIARELDIPLGTVKWHLFEAKKELKRGMDTVRKTSDLKFNPIKFSAIGINGSSGTRPITDYLSSSLAQNICYCVRDYAKTVNEIADNLGVSPVYVESEVERLESQSLLLKNGEKYIVNFIIARPTSELLAMQDSMYKKVAEIFANELYDKLVASGLLDDNDILCGQTDEPIALTESKRADRNFILWSLIPYIAAHSSDESEKERIPFEEVATIRPDGGHNIVNATYLPDDIKLPPGYVSMRNWCGPMWSKYGNNILWQIDNEWTNRGEDHGYRFVDEARRVLSLHEREEEGGILSDEFNDIKASYVDAVLLSVPAHLKKMKEYELQHIFGMDGWFLVHCIVALLNCGKLKEPTEAQRKSLTTVIAVD